MEFFPYCYTNFPFSVGLQKSYLFDENKYLNILYRENKVVYLQYQRTTNDNCRTIRTAVYK